MSTCSEESQPEPLTGSADGLEDVLDSLEEVENEVEEDRPRSSEARGRSLPLHVIDEIGRTPRFTYIYIVHCTIYLSRT